jgi:hypothetical protein
MNRSVTDGKLCDTLCLLTYEYTLGSKYGAIHAETSKLTAKHT